mmetsp:Transcript_677/g.1466  ORF Transcript_677/g.1466 Transcript_677/m.1466 type:complete len:220 (-) Transcript_677:509-1168(-)
MCAGTHWKVPIGIVLSTLAVGRGGGIPGVHRVLLRTGWVGAHGIGGCYGGETVVQVFGCGGIDAFDSWRGGWVYYLLFGEGESSHGGLADLYYYDYGGVLRYFVGYWYECGGGYGVGMDQQDCGGSFLESHMGFSQNRQGSLERIAIPNGNPSRHDQCRGSLQLARHCRHRNRIEAPSRLQSRAANCWFEQYHIRHYGRIHRVVHFFANHLLSADGYKI